MKIGRPIDFYNYGSEGWEFLLLDFSLERGSHILRLECAGKSPWGGGYALGLESVRLLERRPRVTEYGHDKDKDWRMNPVFSSEIRTSAFRRGFDPEDAGGRSAFDRLDERDSDGLLQNGLEHFQHPAHGALAIEGR